ncbi:response regulator transcription factor [Apibacter muscae]|uniref:DNA-binding response regulator n=1 Tax=Apibacter muscae TaxID=2509004 RepID=UPI0011AC4AC2|nr:response regulator transcription factor [Apibacter muscae]TWP31807.1 response regulator transcription factor [Apibacter muscae]
MFEKILICEDFESYSISVKKVLEEFKATNIEQVYYCDDTFFKIQVAEKQKEPYTLLIVDLSFNDGEKKQELKGGEDLIKKIREENINIKIIVFSIENRASKINFLFEKYNIDAFVTKGREDVTDLKEALTKVMNDGIYIPKSVKLSQNNLIDIDEYSLIILKLLSKGMTTIEISNQLKKDKIEPNSESSVKKRLMALRDFMDVTNTKQLISICKDMGII